MRTTRIPCLAAAILLLVVLVVLAAAPATLHAQATPPDLPTYEGWLREAFAAAQRDDRLGLAEIAPNLIATTSVQLSNEASIPVDNRWLEQALQQDPPDMPMIASRLGAMLDALAQPVATVPDDATERLQEMLNNPPFARPDDGGNTLIGRFFEWLLRQIARLLGSGNGDVGTVPANIFGWLVAAASVVLLVGALVYLLSGVRGSVTSDAYLNGTADAEANLTASAAFQQASTLAHGGDYRTAMRYLYLSSLLWLDERDLLRYDRALTNREYLERLHNDPELRSHLAPIVDTFDRVWYGYDTLDSEGFAAYRQQVEALRRRF
jgi:hypothetical protein